jgi:hypothetical protein
VNGHVYRRVPLAALAHRSSRVEESLHAVQFPVEEGHVERCALEDVILLVEVGRDRATLDSWGERLSQNLDVATLRKEAGKLSAVRARLSRADLASIVQGILGFFLRGTPEGIPVVILGLRIIIVLLRRFGSKLCIRRGLS